MADNVHDHPTRKLRPDPVISIPKAPAFLTAFARKEWKRITVELAALELITDIDRAVLTAYCVAWGRFEEAERQIAAARARDPDGQATGLVQVSAKGYVGVSTWLSISRAAAAEASRLALEFGGSSRARSRVKAADTKEANRGRIGRPPKRDKGLAAFGTR